MADMFSKEGFLQRFLQRLGPALRAWVIDHWRGRLSLVESFWINCFFVNLGAGIVLRRLLLSPTGVVFFGVFSVGISVWQLVGLWRSAHRNDKKQPFWSAVVKGLCVMNVVIFVVVVLAVLFGNFGEGGINLDLPDALGDTFGDVPAALSVSSRPSGFLET